MEILLESLSSYGISGVFLGVLIYYLNKLTDIHRDERKEWTASNNDHVDKFVEVIGDNTKALTEMRGELKENRCKINK
jgi:hypothetical protein|tara:strand:- start:1365 stop:1598 length:234 start_codon:yes stop_codon:yes gene_type:complete